MLTSLLVPSLVLLCALVIVLMVIILKLKKKLKQLNTRRNNKSLEYASTIIVPVTRAPVLPQPTWKFSENVAYATTVCSNENEYDTVGEMGSEEVINNTYIDFIGTGQ